jgi:hypothetical protein
MPTVISTNSVAPILYEFLLLVLTGIKCVRSARNARSRTPLLSLILRDGTWAFFAVFGTSSARSLTSYMRSTVSTVCFILNGVFYVAISGPRNAFFFAYVGLHIPLTRRPILIQRGQLAIRRLLLRRQPPRPPHAHRRRHSGPARRTPTGWPPRWP